jgi:hypothetical protein
MAKMIPSVAPGYGERTTGSEVELWKALREQLPDDFVVYHSLPYLKSNAEQGEVDFLLLHRDHGMLVLECKGRGVFRDEDGVWLRKNHNGTRDRLGKSPVEQARSQVESIVEETRGPLSGVLQRSFGRYPLVYGWALAFPYTHLDEVGLPIDLEPEVVIGSQHMTDLHNKVVEALAFHGQLVSDRSMTEEELEDFRLTVLQQPVSLEPNLAGQIDSERRTFAELTDEQRGYFRGLVHNRRFRVEGGAGTGKTMLALHSARLLAQSGMDVLLTCFNKSLGNYLAEEIEQMDDLVGSVRATHFHSLCAEAINKSHGAYSYPADGSTFQEQQTFWAEEAPLALLDVDVGDYDAIIVDEGQDFAPIWWEVLEAALLRDVEDNRLLIFYDEDQRIFPHAGRVPQFQTYVLPYNHRNTKRIAETLREFVDDHTQSHPDCDVGEPPTLYNQPGPSKTQRMVAELLGEFESEGLEAGQIAILSPHRPKNSALSDEGALGEHAIVYDFESWGVDGVIHSTFGAFKGLEADVIVLVDVDPDDPRCSPEALYVAASRARHRLHVFQKSHWLA